MRSFILLISMVLLSACMDNYSIPYLCNDQKCKTQVKENQTETQIAQNEYQTIQDKRSQE